ncbi:hypothetical protein [Gemmata sp.]|uniref:hypothetical protein n=1 Tax=Gemmata sp. TaxID=1914242 RepID=UPI003F71DD02
MRPAALALLTAALAVAALPAADTGRLRPDPVPPPELPRFARIADVRAILDEVALPPLPFEQNPAAAPNFPFPAERLRHYGPDGTPDDARAAPEKFPLRAGVLRALGTLRKIPVLGAPKSALAITQVPSPTSDKFKVLVLKTQDVVAVTVAELELEIDALIELKGQRAAEPRRWQAHYDYALAQVRRRLVFVHEYNKALGDTRTETMPDLPPDSPGWTLVPTEKLHSGRSVKQVLEAATDGFTALAEDCKGTPWEGLATRALAVPPGLRWEPLPPK